MTPIHCQLMLLLNRSETWAGSIPEYPPHAVANYHALLALTVERASPAEVQQQRVIPLQRHCGLYSAASTAATFFTKVQFLQEHQTSLGNRQQHDPDSEPYTNATNHYFGLLLSLLRSSFTANHPCAT
jgi:hypothetical protein